MEGENRGSRSSLNKRSNKYERSRGNSSKGRKETMQCLNAMQLGPPSSKSRGETLSTQMLLSNSGTESSTTLTALPSVPPYTQSLLDIDCEGGYNVSTLSPSNDIPMITSPTTNAKDEKDVLPGIQFSPLTQKIR